MNNPLATLLTTGHTIVTRIVKASVSTLRTSTRCLTGIGKALWALHEQLMTIHGLYRAVVTALTGVVLVQVDFERFILALVVALLRDVRRSSGRYPAHPDDIPRTDLYDGDEDPDGWSFA